MARWEPCSLEDCDWRVQKLLQFCGTTDVRTMFAAIHPHNDFKQACADHMHYLIARMLGNGELPDYANATYFKLPKEVRYLATVG